MNLLARRVLLVWCALGVIYTVLNGWWIPAAVFGFGIFLSAKE